MSVDFWCSYDIKQQLLVSYLLWRQYGITDKAWASESDALGLYSWLCFFLGAFLSLSLKFHDS